MKTIRPFLTSFVIFGKISLSIALIVGLTSFASVQAQNDDATVEETVADEKDDESKSEDELFNIDENAPKEQLIDQLDQIDGYSGDFSSYEEYQAFFEKSLETKLKIVKFLLTQDLTDDEKDVVYRQYITTLEFMNSFGLNFDDPDLQNKYFNELLDLIAKIESDPDQYPRDFYISAKRCYFYSKFNAINSDDETDVDKIKALFAEIKDFVLKNPDAISITISFSQSLPNFVSEELTTEILTDLVQSFRKTKNEDLIVATNKIEAPLRFINLVGSELKLEGTTLDGEKFNWDQYRGKVVLVDFWATWCGPCVGEIPNMLSQYNKYHDQGFEIVGYSVDQDVDSLREFVEKEKTPWEIVSESLSVEHEYPSISEYYAINSIPQMILVDRDGKVLETNVRGNRLNKLLRKLFPQEKKDEPQEDVDFF